MSSEAQKQAESHADKSTQHAKKAVKEASDTIHECTNACKHAMHYCSNKCSHVAHKCTESCSQILHKTLGLTDNIGMGGWFKGLFSKSSFSSSLGNRDFGGSSKAKSTIQQHPLLTTGFLLSMAFMAGLLSSTVGIAGLFSGKGLFSAFRYDTYSYPKNSYQSMAHKMLDQTLFRQQESYMSKMMPSFLHPSKMGEKSYMPGSSDQSFLNKASQYLPIGGHQPQPSYYDQMKQQMYSQPQQQPDQGYLSSLKHTISNIAQKVTPSSKQQSSSYTGFSDDDTEQLKRLLKGQKY